MKKVLLASAVLMSTTLVHGGVVKGTLSQDDPGNVILTSIEKGKKVKREVIMADEFKYTLDEKLLNSPNYVLEFHGDITETKVITDRTPTIVGGKDEMRGRLISDDKGNLYINGVKVRYGRTKPIYGIPFDDKSKNSYVNKDVIVQGDLAEVDGEKVFTINAILESGLISIHGPRNFTAPMQFFADPKSFVLDEMPKNVNSQGKKPWSGRLFEKKGYEPKVGEGVLIITLSGRQGDAPGASAGHFAFGGGVVQEDGTIKGETYNFYFEGPKEVLAGNTDLVSYFGHLIQGQQNYRPTFTLYAYGISPKDLRKVRDIYEKELHKVRTVKGLEITPAYNCTTTSNYVMREIGIYGQHHNLGARLFDFQNVGYVNPGSWWANKSDGKGVIGGARMISYVTTRDVQHYIPRPALESFVKNFTNKRWNKRKGIKRVDYIFIPQTPSDRQVGGMSYDQPIKEGKKIVDYDKARKPIMPEFLRSHEILRNADKHSEAEVEAARKFIAEDQAKVKALLDTID